MKFKTTALILLSAVALIACGKKDKKDGGADNQVQAQSQTVATFRYYKGGFFPPPGAPNWSNDMTITFTTSGFSIVGQHADPLCTRGDIFTEAQATELFNLVSALRVSVREAGHPQTADAGVEYIEITLNNGEVRKYHLMDAEVPAGELYALNPQAVHDYLQELEDSLPTACQ